MNRTLGGRSSIALSLLLSAAERSPIRTETMSFPSGLPTPDESRSCPHATRWRESAESADGAQIAFLRDYYADEGLYVVNADGTGARRVDTAAYPFGRFSWTGR
jgi:hypothetical protein